MENEQYDSFIDMKTTRKRTRSQTKHHDVDKDLIKPAKINPDNHPVMRSVELPVKLSVNCPVMRPVKLPVMRPVKRLKIKQQSPEYIFDMIYDESLINRFFEKYDIINNIIKNSDDLDYDYETIIHDIFRKNLKSVIENEKWKTIDQLIINNQTVFKLGDICEVSFLPDSQKYIDFYKEKTFTGVLIFIDNETQNMIFVQTHGDQNTIKTKDNKIVIKTLEQDGCHYFGMTRGYTYFLKKI